MVHGVYRFIPFRFHLLRVDMSESARNAQKASDVDRSKSGYFHHLARYTSLRRHSIKPTVSDTGK